VTGGYFYHERLRDVNPAARDPNCRTVYSITAAICPALRCSHGRALRRKEKWICGSTT